MADKYSTGKDIDTSTQIKRLLYAINSLNNGESITAQKIANFDNASLKTGYRVLTALKEEFGANIQKIGKEYKLTSKLYNNILDDNALRIYKIIEEANLIDNFVSSDGKKEQLSNELKRARNSSVYEFINKPLEPLNQKDHQSLKILEHAIRNRRKLSIEYKSYNNGKIIKYQNASPYKILFINENFYLLHKSNKALQMARITSILDVVELKEQYYAEKEILDFIKNIQTPFSILGELQEVVLLVDKSKANFFKIKKFFRSQKILKELENGSIEVRYMVTQTKELESFILSWLPYIKIIKPLELKQEIKQALKQALSSI